VAWGRDIRVLHRAAVIRCCAAKRLSSFVFMSFMLYLLTVFIFYGSVFKNDVTTGEMNL